MSGFWQALQSELRDVPVVDPHSHVRPARPQADNLADLVLYHHVWVELVSSGMPAKATSRVGLPHEVADPGMDGLDRVRAALPFLPNIRNTTCAWFLRIILQDLYGVPRGELTRQNLEEVSCRVERRASDPAWQSELLEKRCRVVRTLTVSHVEQPPCSPIVAKGIEGVPIALEGWKQGPYETLRDMEQGFRRELTCGEDYAAAMYALGRARSQREDLHFVGLWILPFIRYVAPREAEITEVLRRVKARQPINHEQMSAFACFGLRHFLAGMRQGRLRIIQLIVGADVLPPHRSITQWAPEFPGTLARIAGEFEDFHFNCSSACDANIQDLAILAKHVPNVSVAGYWWHVLYPYYIRKSIETRLDIVPANKIVAFFSDAYHAEWIYPKLNLVKRIFGEVLRDRVERGLYTPDLALGLVRQVFHENPKRIYGVK